MVDIDNNLVFAIFQVVPPDLEGFNNCYKLIVIHFLSKLRLKSMLLALRFRKFVLNFGFLEIFLMFLNFDKFSIVLPDKSLPTILSNFYISIVISKLRPEFNKNTFVSIFFALLSKIIHQESSILKLSIKILGVVNSKIVHQQ